MKSFAKKFVVNILGWQVRRLRSKNDITVIGVVGSIGKTSTKFAIAKVLKEAKVVRYQKGNYNDIVTVPLVFFGHKTPSLFNPIAWARIFWKNEEQIRKIYPYQVVVVELGTDAPGQITAFEQYIECDYAVVTAISAEHMEFFKTLDAVAKEEMSVSKYSEHVIYNSDLCDKKYKKLIKAPTVSSYGKDAKDATISNIKFTRVGSQFEVKTVGEQHKFSMDAYGLGEIYSATAAITIAKSLGLTDKQIKSAVAGLKPVAGRMTRLDGINDSLILDDTYNASPVAAIAALDTLYGLKAPQKIVVMGNMNELGDHSKAAHQEVGEYCEPAQLDLVVTIGPDANEYLAPAAEKRGCSSVQSFDNPYDAAEAIKQVLKKKAVVLAKGSQNGVYAEETVKLLLKNPKDANKLVRQSKSWLKKKRKNFKRG